MAYPLTHHVNAPVCTKVLIFRYNHFFSYQSTPQLRTPSWAYLPYLPLEREARERRNETQAKQAFMHACACSNHPISPLIIFQFSNLSLYTMFALLHCTFTITRDKQCACCIRSKQDLYVYVLFFEFILSFLDSFFFVAPRGRRGIPTSIIYCVSRHFLIITWHTVIIFFFVFSGAQLGCAPARRLSLRVNPGISKFS